MTAARRRPSITPTSSLGASRAASRRTRWLDDGTSLYDHFGLGYSLLLLDESGAAVRTSIADAADAAGVPLKLIDLRDTDLAQLYEAPLALIRPDQYVAWRGSDADAAALVDTIRGVAAEGAARRAAS